VRFEAVHNRAGQVGQYQDEASRAKTNVGSEGRKNAAMKHEEM
jgi:hypothetical protein